MTLNNFESVSHEIKTPLTAIHFHAQLLKRLEKDGTLSKEFLQESLECIEQESKKLTHLIKGLDDHFRSSAT